MSRRGSKANFYCDRNLSTIPIFFYLYSNQPGVRGLFDEVPKLLDIISALAMSSISGFFGMTYMKLKMVLKSLSTLTDYTKELEIGSLRI